MSIRLIVADDHPILRAGLKGLLNADPGIEVIGEADDGEQTVALTATCQPDLVLMDIHMPRLDGVQATRKILEQSPTTRVLILSMHEDREMLQECLRAGASGYVIKRAAEAELINAIYAVTRGVIYIHPSLVQSLVTPTQPTPPPDPSAEPLTAREIEVLCLITRGHTNREIAALLHISVRTVETHRSNLMDKLHLHSRVDLIRYAVENKLIRLDSI
jgi:DNA-binding NarL/FixJ family response regulator